MTNRIRGATVRDYMIAAGVIRPPPDGVAPTPRCELARTTAVLALDDVGRYAARVALARWRAAGSPILCFDAPRGRASRRRP